MIALPLTTKLMAGLGLALALSLSANVYQLRRAWMHAAEDRTAAERATLQAQVQAAQHQQAIQQALADRAARDNAELLNDLATIAERARTDRVRIRTINRANPLPAQCSPGMERVESVNRALGAAEDRP
jgi:hypothetical protein